MSGTLKKISGPTYLAAAAANIYTPPASTIYTVIKHIRVVNKTAVADTFTLYVGATGGSAAGTELVNEKAVAADDYVDLYFTPGLKLLSTEFLTGLAASASTLTITVMGEQHVV